MTPQEALAAMQRLFDLVDIHANNAAMNYDFRQMLPPDLLEECEQALATLEQVVQPSDPEITVSQ